MRSGKLVCTARGAHRSRTLATYHADDDMFLVSSKQPMVAGEQVAHYARGVSPGLTRVRFRCPSCTRDLQFKSETLLAFLLIELPSGATRRDLSRLEAAAP